MTSASEYRRPRLVRHARYRWDEVRGQHQVVFPEGVLVLNETGASIVKLCDGRSTAELIEELKNNFPHVDVETDVNEFLNRLAVKGLLSDADDA